MYSTYTSAGLENSTRPLIWLMTEFSKQVDMCQIMCVCVCVTDLP